MQMQVSIQWSARVEGWQQALLLAVLRLQDEGVCPQSTQEVARQALPPVSVPASHLASATVQCEPPMRRLCSEQCQLKAARTVCLVIKRAGVQVHHRLLQALAHRMTTPTTTRAPSRRLQKILMAMRQLLLARATMLPCRLSQKASQRRRGRQPSQQQLPVPMPMRIA